MQEVIKAKIKELVGALAKTKSSSQAVELSQAIYNLCLAYRYVTVIDQDDAE